MKKALMIVDPQIDFISGSMPVFGAINAMNALTSYIRRMARALCAERTWSGDLSTS